jgi:PTH2 family peptidyl-tRNA hydrolase
VYLYAIVRKDLQMPVGKLSAQAGHAFTDTVFSVLDNPQYTTLLSRYLEKDNAGSKVVLSAKNENQLLDAYNLLKGEGVPCSLVVDSEHVLPPFFDGSPVVTALGVGPCRKSDVKHILKKFQCI